MIVPITEEHITGFHRVLGRVARERRYLTYLDAPPLESTERYVRETIANDRALFVALAVNDEVVGWCDILPINATVHAHVGALGIGLLPAFRGKGIGRQLMSRALAKAHSAGLWRIQLTVYADNLTAIRLYVRAGFEVEGRQKSAAQIDGRLIDLVLMARLRPPQ
jgi:RimJ/RimL family protein N-acetyltransferase